MTTDTLRPRPPATGRQRSAGGAGLPPVILLGGAANAVSVARRLGRLGVDGLRADRARRVRRQLAASAGGSTSRPSPAATRPAPGPTSSSAPTPTTSGARSSCRAATPGSRLIAGTATRSPGGSCSTTSNPSRSSGCSTSSTPTADAAPPACRPPGSGSPTRATRSTASTTARRSPCRQAPALARLRGADRPQAVRRPRRRRARLGRRGDRRDRDREPDRRDDPRPRRPALQLLHLPRRGQPPPVPLHQADHPPLPRRDGDGLLPRHRLEPRGRRAGQPALPPVGPARAGQRRVQARRPRRPAQADRVQRPVHRVELPGRRGAGSTSPRSSTTASTGRPQPPLERYDAGPAALGPGPRLPVVPRAAPRAASSTFGGWLSSVLHRQTFPYFDWTDPLPALARLDQAACGQRRCGLAGWHRHRVVGHRPISHRRETHADAQHPDHADAAAAPARAVPRDPRRGRLHADRPAGRSPPERVRPDRGAARGRRPARRGRPGDGPDDRVGPPAPRDRPRGGGLRVGRPDAGHVAADRRRDHAGGEPRERGRAHARAAPGPEPQRPRATTGWSARRLGPPARPPAPGDDPGARRPRPDRPGRGRPGAGLGHAGRRLRPQPRPRPSTPATGSPALGLRRAARGRPTS